MKRITLMLMAVIGIVTAPHALAVDGLARGSLSRCDDVSVKLIEQLKLEALTSDEGSADAQNMLGAIYGLGCGVQQDDKESAKWYRIGATQGDAGAQYFLGSIYAHGQGVPQDWDEAVRWFRLSADQGYAFAQQELSVMYANGTGIQQNRVVAYVLISICPDIDVTDHGRLTINRFNLRGSLTLQELKEADELAKAITKSGNLLKSIDHYIDSTSIPSAVAESTPSV